MRLAFNMLILPFNITERGKVGLSCSMLGLRFNVTDRRSVRLLFNITRLPFNIMRLTFNITDRERVTIWCLMLRPWRNMHRSLKRKYKFSDREQMEEKRIH